MAKLAAGVKSMLQFDDPVTQQEWDKWFAKQTPAVRAVIEQFPPGAALFLDGRKVYVVSYPTMKGGAVWLGLTYINPRFDHDAAFAGRLMVCPDHFDQLRPAEAQ